MKNSALKRYYPILWDIRATFGGGILAGLVYGAASGLGLPTMVKYVFPILFHDEKGMKKVPEWLLDFHHRWLGDSVQSLSLLVCF